MAPTSLRKPGRWLLAIVLLIALPASGQVTAGQASDGQGLDGQGSDGQIAGDGVDQAGQQHSLTESGAYTVVDFAASWCRPCYQALPALQQLADQHSQIRFLVISVDDEVAGRDQLVDDLQLHLPVIWDADHKLIKQFQPKSFPATYVLDANGQIVMHHVGYSKAKLHQLASFLDQLDMTADRRGLNPTVHSVEPTSSKPQP